MDPIERIESATTFASGKVKEVTPADLAKPTPCSEFDVRALLNHMLGGLSMLTAAAGGEKPAMPEGDQFGSDPAPVYDESRRALITAVRGKGVLDRQWQMPFGAMSGAMMAQIAFMEHLAHGWDLAKATGQDTTLPADLVMECMEVVTPMDAMLRMPGVCGPVVSVPESAPPQDKLVAFLGRRPE